MDSKGFTVFLGILPQQGVRSQNVPNSAQREVSVVG